MVYIMIAVIAVIAYLLGSINTSIIVGKTRGIDIREHGSKNAGLTNTLRTLGKGAALVVLIGDLLKGVIAILVARLLAPEVIIGNVTIGEEIVTVTDKLTTLSMQIAGIAVVLGHIFPVFYKFKGGKGVLTSAVVILMTNWKIGLICLLVFIVIVAVTRYVSLGSIMAALTYPAIVLGSHRIAWIGDVIDWLVFGLILATLVIVKHHTNIKRLLMGEENRLSFKKKKVETEVGN